MLLIYCTLLSTNATGEVARYAPDSKLAQGNWYKLAMTQEGVYRIGYNDLVEMGINPSTIDPSRIGIFGRGGSMLPELNSEPREDDMTENAIEVTGSADGKFDQTDQILFYAQGPVTWKYQPTRQIWEHITHIYSDTICYFLSTDQGQGKRIGTMESITSTVSDQVETFDFRASNDENMVNLLLSGRQWFGQTFDVITSKQFSFNIPTLVAEGIIKIKTTTAARSVSMSSFNFSVGDKSWSAQHMPVSTDPNSEYATLTTVYNTLNAVVLPFKMNIQYNKTASGSVGYLDMIDITARCDLKFTEGQMSFRDGLSYGTGRTALFKLKDAAAKARIWNVSNPEDVLNVASTTEGNTLTFKAKTDDLPEFVAFDETHFLKPRFVKKIANQNLHANLPVDLVIIAPSQFTTQATRLATFHANTSDLSVLVTSPENIYNEFSSGTPDITAIRDFIKMLYDKGSATSKPKYLLLFGDASYDYKDKTASNTNLVPTWQSPESLDPIYSIVSDDYFGFLDENEGVSSTDVLDIGIGRLPVKSLFEAEQAVDKIIHYATPSDKVDGDWRNIVAFVADDENFNEHIDNSEIMADRIEKNYPDMNIDKIYLDSYVQIVTPGGNRYPDVNKAITQRMEKGCLLLNYIGHGGETGWAHEQVLTVAEINNWSNYNALPVFITATCEFGRFDNPGRTSAGEYAFLNPKGGSIALFTTTRPTFGTPNFELNKKFYEYALATTAGKHLRMGDILLNSKRIAGANLNGQKYVLLGDPALQITFPENKVITTSMNGHPPTDQADTLKALMTVSIEGAVTDFSGNVLTDFQGTVYPTVFDKSVLIKTLSNDGEGSTTFNLRKNYLYKGKVAVSNGHFSYSFIVPKDIAYHYDFGKISYYATDGNRDASGNYTNILVGGLYDRINNDNSGPAVQLFMNDTLFKDYGITDQNPRLLVYMHDENGINTIGNGIGHDITAVLDDNYDSPYVLNEFYQSDINTFKSGFIRFPFSLLAAGDHTLAVRVWDIFNNSTESVIHFSVKNSAEFVISKTYNYPNPFNASTFIRIEHNQPDASLLLHLEIYSYTGSLVRVLESSSDQSGSLSTAIPWDGTDNEGNKVPSGMYIYSMTIRTSNGLFGRTSGKMIFKK